MDLDLIISA